MTVPTETAEELERDDLMAVYMGQWKSLRAILKQNIGSGEVADDAMQETWLRLHKIKQPSAPVRDRQAYILRLAANIAIDLVRREKRHTARCVSDEALLRAIADTCPSPETLAIDRDHLRQLAEALSQLPATHCAALLMSRCDGLTHRDIAAALKVSERAVAKYLFNALRHCRDHFRRLG